MSKIKLLFVILFSTTLFVSGQDSNVVYKDYDNYEYKILQQLKESGNIMSFTSMPALKKQSTQIIQNNQVVAQLPAAGKKPMTGEEMVRNRKESTLLICKYSPKLVENEGVKIGATAIAVSEDGLCISNYHVFESMIDPRINLSPLDSILFVATESGKIYSINSILTYNREADIVVFKIDLKGDKIPAIPFGDDLAAGANIHALTHPYRHFFYYSDGVVARTICSDVNNPFTNRTDITADYAKGSSGGALMDDSGNLVGMVCTTQSIYYADYPQTSLQMVVKSIIPISSIKRLVHKN